MLAHCLIFINLFISVILLFQRLLILITMISLNPLFFYKWILSSVYAFLYSKSSLWLSLVFLSWYFWLIDISRSCSFGLLLLHLWTEGISQSKSGNSIFTFDFPIGFLAYLLPPQETAVIQPTKISVLISLFSICWENHVLLSGSSVPSAPHWAVWRCLCNMKLDCNQYYNLDARPCGLSFKLTFRITVLISP